MVNATQTQEGHRVVRALMAAAAAWAWGFTEHQILSRSSRAPGTGGTAGVVT